MTLYWHWWRAALVCIAILVDAALIQDSQPNSESRIEPLARLTHRLTLKDWVGAKQLADTLSPSDWPSHSVEAALIDVARFRGAMATGEYESAVVPWLRCMANPQFSELPESLALDVRPTAAATRWTLAPGLLPLFFDPDRAAREYQQLVEGPGDAEMPQHDSWRIYAAGLAIAANRAAEIDQKGLLRVESSAEIDADLEGWRLLFQSAAASADGKAPMAREHLASTSAAGEANPAFRAMHDYYAAVVAESAASEPGMDSLLQWLQVAAAHRHEFPQVASAALYRAATIARGLQLESEARRIEDELAFSFPHSFHGRMIRAERVSR